MRYLTVTGVQACALPISTASGSASFSLTPGASYSICEVTQATWINSDPGGAAPFCKSTGTLASGDTPSLLFGNYQNESLTAVKNQSSNANASRDACEPTLNGWVFFVDSNNNGFFF